MIRIRQTARIYQSGQPATGLWLGGQKVWSRPSWAVRIRKMAPIYWDFTKPAETYQYDRFADGIMDTLIWKVSNEGYAGSKFNLIKTGPALDTNAPLLGLYGAQMRRTSGGVGDTMAFPNARPTLNGVRTFVLVRLLDNNLRNFMHGADFALSMKTSLAMTLKGEVLNSSLAVPLKWMVAEVAVYSPEMVGPNGTIGFCIDGGPEEQLSFATSVVTDGNMTPQVIFGNTNSVSGESHVNMVVSLDVRTSSHIFEEVRAIMSAKRDTINAELGL